MLTWPEQDDEAVQLDTHANDGPAEQHHQDAPEESPAALGLVPLEEESEGSLQPDHTRQPRQEQYLQSEDMNNILCLDI